MRGIYKNIGCLFALLLLLPIALHAQIHEKIWEEALNKAKSGQLKESLVFVENNKEEQSPYFHSVAGEIMMLAGQYDRAYEHFGQAISLFQKGENQDMPALIHSYANLGIYYWNQGRNNQAEEQLKLALDLALKLPEKNIELIADIENNLGLIFSEQAMEKSLDYYKKALEGYQSQEGLFEKSIQTKINIGIIYRNMGVFPASRNTLFQALEELKERGKTNSHLFTFTIQSLGQSYQKEGDLENATKYLQQALTALKNTHGERHRDIAGIYNLLGEIALQKREFRGSIQYFQRSLKANTWTFQAEDWSANPSAADCIHLQSVLYTLLRKASALRTFYSSFSLNNKHLALALNALDAADQIISTIRQTNLHSRDQVAVSELTYEVYELAQLISLQLADGSARKKYFKTLAFEYAEKSRAATLQKAFAESKAQNFAGVPAAIIEKEKAFKAKISLLEIQMLQGGVESITLKEELNQERSAYEKFLLEVQLNYPQYFELKNANSKLNLAAIQSMLKPNETMLSFQWIEMQDEIILYQVSQKKLDIFVITEASTIRRNIRGLRNAIQYKLKSEWQNIAFELNKKLLPGKIQTQTSHLFIIPDADLSILPFEILLFDKPNLSIAQNSSLPYLMNRYSISYNFSADMVFRSKEKKGNATDALLIAPVSFASLALPDLPGTYKEIRALDQLFASKEIATSNLNHEKASKEVLSQYALSNFRYIHLATHGLVDEGNPELSHLIFSSGVKNQPFLYANEIYNWQLESDLVCLSACETGLGKLSRGEGIIGLSRAFTFAGASNIMVSMWTVSDDSTTELMLKFYQDLLSENGTNGHAGALQRSKIALAGSEQYHHPYYWAAFQLIGK